ncbi:SMI1/KNR4 family protein [Maribacter sp. BPC-D8]|uniref:SMI1/KNR4 family protein n=1 Tax=Maribacter sp. BPC-D8 TaxID=3053613 RepID=UPI002B49FAC8|nr:SMI1/KNR4 family protein [Maribacter sp. BPC-D8]WRI29225.1 SMI1/KNR4 family protein [Maribacter sp. BPC-D8]
MKNIWNSIQLKINSIDHKAGNSFNRPATDSEINVLNSHFDQKIPIEFINYLRVYNGQNHNNFEIQPFNYYAFIPVKEILEIVKMQNELWADEESIASISENKIQPKQWDKNWLPIASEASSYLILDMNPGKNGVFGQIFQLFSGMDYEDNNIVLADSFLEFSEILMHKLESKDYEIEDDEPTLIFKNDWI